MGNLKRIVNVKVDIRTPANSAASFDNLLIVGRAPAIAPANAPYPVGAYTDLEGVTDAGWKITGDDADPVGIAARIAFSQNPQPAKIFIAVRQELEGGELETITDTLDRALKIKDWYVVCPAGVDEGEFESIAEWTEAQIKLFAFTYVEAACPVGSIYYRSFGFDGKTEDEQLPADVPAANRYLHVAAAAKCLAYPAGSETWKLKQLAAVYPSDFTSTKSDALEAAHLNYFIECGGKNVTMNGQVMAGEWIDVIRFRDWLQNDIQYRIYNLLIMNTKIPYTDRGIALVENQIIAGLKAAQEAGGVVPDEFDADGLRVPGFTVTVPRAMNLSASEKASRALTGCKFSARLVNAIHAVTVNGELTH